ncbi:hypothetical protein [Kytococcus sedentarius]|uniref:hypothetical protein n=1 Tax=Kytococcus sedentarius TaxID=1276 RepID=UPI00384C4F7C
MNRDPWRLMLVRGPLASLLVLAVSVPTALWTRGPEGAVTAAGVCLVTMMVLTAGLVMVRTVLDGAPALVVPMALLVFFLQVGIFAAAVFLVPWPDGFVFALVGGLAVIAWQAGVVQGYVAGRHAMVFDDPADPADPGADPAASGAPGADDDAAGRDDAAEGAGRG